MAARFGTQEVTAKFFPNQAPKLGDAVQLAVDMERVCLFDAETEQAHRMSDEFARYPSLKGAVFLVSGGASGIGADIVKAAHDQGAKVAFLDIQDAAGRALAADSAGLAVSAL